MNGDGVNYVPGLRQIHGWDSLIEFPGSSLPSLHTHPFPATTEALSRLEFQCLRAPWCYMIDPDAIEARWQAAIDSWAELKARIYYRGRGQGGGPPFMDLFRDAPPGVVPLIQRQIVRCSDPGWWINCSRVTVTSENGDVERIVPGPVLQPREFFSPPGAVNPNGYVMSPLDYYAGSECGSNQPQPGTPTAKDLGQNPGAVAVMDDPWMNGPINSTRRVYRPGEDPLWGEPFEPGPGSPGRAIWPIVPDGEVVEWTDLSGQLGKKGSKVVTGSIMDIAIRPWLEKVRAAQYHYQGTHWCAYVHPGMPAFRSNPGLRLYNAARFGQLLKSPSRFQLRTEDVMDNVGPGSRKEMLQNAGVCFPGKFTGCQKVQAEPPGPKPPITVSGFQALPDVPDVDPEDPPAPIPPVDLPPPVPPGDETPPDEPDPVLDPEAKPPSPWPWAIAAAAVGYAAAKGKG